MNITFKKVTSPEELQMAVVVRGIVFEEEQHCAYIDDFDGEDYAATHFLGLQGNEPVATARVRLFKGYVKIERVAVRKACRGKSVGKELMLYILRYIGVLGYERIVLHAQSQTVKFYERLGFVKEGAEFLEANIAHYRMERQTTDVQNKQTNHF